MLHNRRDAEIINTALSTAHECWERNGYVHLGVVRWLKGCERAQQATRLPGRVLQLGQENIFLQQANDQAHEASETVEK